MPLSTGPHRSPSLFTSLSDSSKAPFSHSCNSLILLFLIMSQTPHIHVDRLITKISTPEIIISVTPKSLQTPPAIKSVRPTKTKQTPTAKKSVRSPKDSILNFLGSRSKQLMEKISPERAPKVTAESVPAVPACTSTVPVTPTDTAPIREHSQSKLDRQLA